MQTIYGVTSGENIVQAFTEENTTEANFHQSINNAAILTFTTTEPLKAGVQFFLTKDPINDYKHEEFMYFEITDQDFDGYEYTYRAEEYAYHDLDTMGYVKRIYTQGKWTTRTLLESITYNDVEPKGVARTKWQIVDNDLTLPTTWAGEGNTYTLWYNTPLRGIEKFIEYFGGEIRFYVTIVNNKISGHFLEVYEKRGRETGKRYESNSNLISLTNKAEYSNRYEYIIPLAEGGGASGDEETHNTPNGFNNYITLEGLEVGKSTDKWYKPKSQLYISLANDKNAYPLKSQPKGLQNNPRIKPVTFEDVKSKEALFDKAIEWLENNQGVAWSYSASVLDIGESQVGDTIAIIDERSGISSYVRVHDIDYDMIDPENTGVHFGSNWGYENDEAITDMLNTATAARHDTLALIDTAIRQSNGKNTNYYGENEPAEPIDGDLWYKRAGDETYLMIFKDGHWVELVSTRTQKAIADAVDEATSEASSYADSLNATQASEAATFKSEANASLSSAAAERTVFSSNASSMASSAATHADSMANSAAVYGKVQAASALSSANLELAKAKQELGSEVSKAQSDIIATNQELSGKVSQSDYDKKTQELSTQYGQVKVTADNVTTEVTNYKIANDKKVSANAASIETLNNQITSKVSQTDFDKATGDLNGKYTETKQTVDKISNTVSELQAKANSQGQVNQLTNTEFTPDLEGWTSDVTDVSSSKPYISSIRYPYGSRSIGFNTLSAGTRTYAYLRQDVLFSISSSAKLSISWRAYGEQVANYNNMFVRFYDSSNTLVDYMRKPWATTGSRWEVQKIENITIPDTAVSAQISFEAREGSLVYLLQPMVTFTDTVGDYVAGNYNNNSRVAALEVDLDSITGLVNDPKKGLSATATLAANGLSVATKAQSEATIATQTAQGTQTTVTNVQKDVKDLQSTTLQTAGQVKTEIEDRKSGDKSVVTQMTGLIDQRLIDTKKGYESAISQSADTIMASVSMPNKLVNTEFEPDLEGWTISNPLSGTGNPAIIYTSNGYGSSNGLRINAYSYNEASADAYYQIQQIVKVPSNVSVASMHIMGFIYATSDNGYAYINANVLALDSTGKNISAIVPGTQLFDKTNTATWQESSSKFINMSIPNGTDSLRISVYVRGKTSVNISQPMLVFANAFSIYQAGSYNNMGTSTVLELFKDNWALGIADNAGRLISGINGDTSGTVIQGKKLVINSDTTINGKAFIDGSVIKNASIGTAQIGKAAVGSAQIINVDVSKISGNIAEFVTGNINRLNSSVLYGNTGHLTTVDTGLIINNQDDHLQLASHGQYDVPTKRAQFELLGYADNIDTNMQGSLNYYKNPHNAGTGLGIRFYGNQILAIDEALSTGNLYLSPYASGQVQVVNRDRNGFQDIKASKFVTSSERKYKSEIEDFNDNALELVNNLNIRKYIKNNEDEIGVIADETDERILDKDNTGVDLYSFVSVLTKAVQELTDKVEELQKEIPNDY